MKILHIRSSGGFYGAEAVILNLSRAVHAHGAGTYICCINNKENPHNELVERAKEFGLEASMVQCCGMFDHQTIKSIRDLLVQKKIDILHCHDYKATVFGLLAAKDLKITRIHTNHLWTHDDLKLRCYEFLEGILTNWFNCIVAVSDSIAKEIRPFIWDKKRLSVISNGIDFDRFKNLPQHGSLRKEYDIRGDEIVVGVIGRYAAQKGHEYLFRALAKITELDKDILIKLFVVGHGELERQFKKIVANLKIEDRVIFAGFRNDILPVLNTIDFLAMPSLSEGLPIVLLEAMAAGVPVVVTPVGGIPKLIKDGETGFVVQPKDVDGLADAIKKMIEMRDHEMDRLQRIVQNAQELVEKQYSARIMAEKYYQLYQSSLNSLNNLG